MVKTVRALADLKRCFSIVLFSLLQGTILINTNHLV
jgi:hypothetical protein